ncbi:hypothetical protein [Natronorubrum halophilum]|uniref:hypothetical protein n=1 Tax=Natronorubrum halophilum TaxID=1702106 RepID=UPI0013CF1348|nr:hypothetical protein [Natronorubrum halophilum]
MPDGSESLEESIVDKFIDSLESSDIVSEEVSTVISGLSDEDDFGGRDQVAEQALEAVSEDED